MGFSIITVPNISAHATVGAVNLSASDVDSLYSGPDTQTEPGVPATSIPQTMFLRFVIWGAQPAMASGNPTLVIKCGDGKAQEMTLTYPSSQGMVNVDPPGGATDSAAGSRFDPDANNVFLVKVFIFVSGNPYQISIKNNDGGPHDFLLVVAGSLSDSRQPWLDATGALTYDGLVNEVISQSVSVNNKGTGPLTVNGFAPSPTAPFAFAPPAMPSLPATIAPNQSALFLPITFTAPGAPPAPNGASSATTSVDSSDPGAGSGGGHNKAVSLNATTRKLEVVLLLDDSGSMTLGSDSNPPVDSAHARWSQLASATKLFLELLGGFGQGTGTFGIVKFPGPNPNDLTTFDVLEPTPIPPATGMKTAKDLIDAIKPFNSTPLGDGIARVVSPGIGYFSSYNPNGSIAQQVNRRWLLIFSDGKNNSGAADPRGFISSTVPGAGGTAAPGASLADRHVSAYSVAYGIAGTSQVDSDLMHYLAQGSFNGGRFSQIDTAPNASAAQLNASALDLANSLKSAIFSGIGTVTAPTDPRGALALGQVAQFPVQITSYDERAAFVLAWEEPFMGLFTLSLITPLGEVITQNQASRSPGVSFSQEQRYAMYQVENTFLSNKKDPTKSRFGAWTLVVQREFNDIPESLRGQVPFEYSVMVRSRLRLDVRFDRQAYYAGDSIGLKASLLLDGKSLTGVQVKAAVDSPNQSANNFLAGAIVTQKEYEAMKRKLAKQDANAIYIKGMAAAAKGVIFTGTSSNAGVPLTDAKGDGEYSGSVADTATPDVYKFVVEAVGQTPDGRFFQREFREQIRVAVKPDESSTLIDLQPQPSSGQNSIAIVRVIPRDRFGNAILLDPADNGSIVFTTSAGKFTTPITSIFDGSYTQTLSYPSGSTPVIGVQIWGRNIVHGRALPPIGSLVWADHLISYHEGGQAEPGANLYTDGSAALGNPFDKGLDRFVSLGSHGTLTVGASGKEVLSAGANDLVVVVHPDYDLRAYEVEAEDAFKTGRWIQVGESAGVTQGFNLKKAGVRAASAIRIIDKSGRTRDNSLSASRTPGVSICGVGFQKIGIDPGPPPPPPNPDCLEKLCKILHKICS